jgi:prepilin-type N-terminal cleavage/methylation domain-containing protein
MRGHLELRGSGFTLVEIAIVLVVIGLILAVVLRAAVFVPKAQVNDLIGIANQLQSAVSTFKQTYHMYPGDMPDTGAPTGPFLNLAALTNSDDAITGTTDCDYNGGTSGNGLIGDGGSEVDCVLVHLNRAGLITEGEKAGSLIRIYANEKIKINVVSFEDSTFATDGTAKARYLSTQKVQHVVEYLNMPLDLANEFDRKSDDGDLTTGRVQAIDDTSDPNTMIVRLN